MFQGFCICIYVKIFVYAWNFCSLAKLFNGRWLVWDNIPSCHLVEVNSASFGWELIILKLHCCVAINIHVNFVRPFWFSWLSDFTGVCYFVALHNSHTIYSISQFDLTGLAAALTNESATSKSVFFEHCTSEMIFIIHLIAEEPERLAGPLLADT